MTIVEMLEQSGILTLLGMGIVFAFLALMILCITLVGKIVHRLKLDADIYEPATGSLPAAGTALPSGSAGTDINAVISSAVHEYRKDHGAGADSYIVTVDGRDYKTSLNSGGSPSPAVEITAASASESAPLSAAAAGNTGEANPMPGSPSAGGASVIIPSPVAGTVIRHAAAEGSPVTPGDTVVIIESMKMELEIKATHAGLIHFLKAPGTQVAAQDTLAEIG